MISSKTLRQSAKAIGGGSAAWRSALLVIAQSLLVAFAATAQGLPSVPEPSQNRITETKRILGKLLFWEEQLSSDNSTACGSCHIPGSGGSDPRTPGHPGPDQIFGNDDDVVGSLGIRRSNFDNERVRDSVFGFAPQVTGRSAPSFFGMSAFAPSLFWDGRATSVFVDPETGTVSIPSGGALESQAIAPILSDVEMAKEGRDWADVRDKLQRVQPMAIASNLPSDMSAAVNGNTTYPELFDAAFGDPNITAERIAFALATYERTLIPNRSPWDRFEAGDLGALTAQQVEGLELITDHTVCFNCHQPPQFTDHGFHNIGLRPSSEDLGLQEVTGSGSDRGRFKTPTLRNSGLKPAQMHVGWVFDVKDAIDYYNAVSQVTRHFQFTADQTGIPTSDPNRFQDYDRISMPVTTAGGQAFQGPVIDFISNGLTDPRVANEQFPFDRPTLRGGQGLCDDGLDNDGDGLTDFPQDPSCSSAASNGEGDRAGVPAALPAAPSDLAANPASVSAIDLTWLDHSTEEESYVIERRPSGGVFSEIATVAANVVVFTDTGLQGGALFDYRVAAANALGQSSFSNVATATTFEPTECVETGQTLCLNGGRFQVEIDWRDFQDGAGFGQVVVSSQDSGLFWFFQPDNWEMMVKILNGCGLNDRFWVFAAATTNVEYTLRVTDTQTAMTKQYFNSLGTAAPAIIDTDAFATCP